MKNRKTITFNADMLLVSEKLKDSDRLVFYDGIFNHFLKGENLPHNNISETLELAFAYMAPQLRVLQSKFNNGTQKKSIQETKATLCPSETSESKRTEAEGNETYNINNPFPKLIYIFNKYNNSNQSTACVYAHAREPFKTTNDDELEYHLTNLENEHPALYQFFQKLINKVDTQTIKIRGVITEPKKIIQTIAKCVPKYSFINMLETARSESSQAKVQDPLKYAVSVLYNLCNEVQVSPPADFSQREYTKEELDSLFDSLDDIPLD